jgi:hypothetical protein
MAQAAGYILNVAASRRQDLFDAIDPSASEPDEANERGVAAMGEFRNGFGKGSSVVNTPRL